MSETNYKCEKNLSGFFKTRHIWRPFGLYSVLCLELFGFQLTAKLIKIILILGLRPLGVLGRVLCKEYRSERVLCCDSLCKFANSVHILFFAE